MKKMRKNNKGFSLVELIVVVLIMAIIAVALAPQIMKWVGTSRTSSDTQTYDTLVENIQLALTDEEALAEIKALGTGKVTFTIGANLTTVTFPAGGKFEAAMDKVCGADWEASVKKKDSSAVDYVITVNSSATVEKTTVPGTTPTPKPAS